MAELGIKQQPWRGEQQVSMNGLEWARADSALPRGWGTGLVPHSLSQHSPKLILLKTCPFPLKIIIKKVIFLLAPMCLFKTSLLKGFIFTLSLQKCSNSEGVHLQNQLVEPHINIFPSYPFLSGIRNIF